jgi:hypothetical protein
MRRWRADLISLDTATEIPRPLAYLIRPVGQIDRQLIVSEKPNIDQIVATLGLKEMTQGTLIRKLCTYTAPNPARRAIFEFDKLVRSTYTLRYGIGVRSECSQIIPVFAPVIGREGRNITTNALKTGFQAACGLTRGNRFANDKARRYACFFNRVLDLAS